ncbi:MAG: molybdenum ABC transporter ATP-binding protein [Deltaproteobacteria bacterium]|nr:molybdenum ABC transporter ATP-binding protein [Deltaproteobacteria bacterium]|tara:strand:+ start:9895 stop:10632 length:738 start_codon:yes stop_codon:yes gene_type:complete
MTKWSIDITFRRGHFVLDVQLKGTHSSVAIIGPNGSGKTTLLRTIAGAYRPEAGHIQMNDRLLNDTSQALHLPPEDRQMGYVPQGYQLFPHLDVLDNISFGRSAHTPQGKGQRRQRAKHLLEQLGCAALIDRKVRGLSGGEQQRVAIARALYIQPHWLLLDEPLSALDPRIRREVRDFLRKHIIQETRPLFLVTHDMRDVFALCNYVYVIEDGKVAQEGTPEELRTHPTTPFVEEFFFADMISRT